jgi:hypothetical protein
LGDREPANLAAVEPLLTRQGLARFLDLSPSWIDTALATPPEEEGSIPHVELPTSGRRRQVRFIPADVREWLRRGCPSARDFEVLRTGA